MMELRPGRPNREFRGSREPLMFSSCGPRLQCLPRSF